MEMLKLHTYLLFQACCDKLTVSIIHTNLTEETMFTTSGTGPVKSSFIIEEGDIVRVHFHTDYSNVAQGFRLLFTPLGNIIRMVERKNKLGIVPKLFATW